MQVASYGATSAGYGRVTARLVVSESSLYKGWRGLFWPATSEVWKKAIKDVHLSLHLPRNKSGPSGSSILPRNRLFYHVPPKFVARRGNPQVIYSDNGTNFVGADRELKECIENWNQDKIANELSPKGIKWVFNPTHGGSVGEISAFM